MNSRKSIHLAIAYKSNLHSMKTILGGKMDVLFARKIFNAIAKNYTEK